MFKKNTLYNVFEQHFSSFDTSYSILVKTSSLTMCINFPYRTHFFFYKNMNNDNTLTLPVKIHFFNRVLFAFKMFECKIYFFLCSEYQCV